MNNNIKAFLKVLDHQDNKTGGGTASAVAGAMAASLTAMVGRLSLGKEQLETDVFYIPIIEEAEQLSSALFDGGYRDSHAFESVSRAFKMPKATDDQKKARTKAIREGWITATIIPLENSMKAGRVLELAQRLQGRSNPNARSDLDCALYLARAAILGCLENVDINIPNIKEKKTAERLSQSSTELRRQAHEMKG